MTDLQLGSIYGTVKYGEATYGRPMQPGMLPIYSAAPMVATPTSYSTIQITWSIPGAGQTLQLVRNNYSASLDQNDGIVLLSQGLTAGALYVDSALSPTQQGTFQYYTLWNYDPNVDEGTWFRAADVQALLPKQWGYGARLYSLVPQYYQYLDTQVSTLAAIVQAAQMTGDSISVSEAEAETTITETMAGTAEGESSAEGDIGGGTAEAESSAEGTMELTQEESGLYQAEGESSTFGNITSWSE